MKRTGIVLLIEDRRDDIDLTLRAFGKMNLADHVVVSRDGEDALSYLFGTGTYAGRDTSLQPEVVLLDLKLPKMDGLSVLRRMRSDPRTSRVPVVVLTSSQEESDIAASYDSGANSFIRKPVDFSDFLETTHQLGVYWLTVNQALPLSLEKR
ncbi:MAG: response regulator [Pseudomonadota bacterium]